MINPAISSYGTRRQSRTLCRKSEVLADPTVPIQYPNSVQNFLPGIPKLQLYPTARTRLNSLFAQMVIHFFLSFSVALCFTMINAKHAISTQSILNNTNITAPGSHLAKLGKLGKYGVAFPDFPQTASPRVSQCVPQLLRML